MYLIVYLIAGFALSLITVHFLLMLFTPHPPPTLESEKQFTTTPSSKTLALPSFPSSDQASSYRDVYPLRSRERVGLSVVVPAYNEDERLGIMIDEAMEYFLDAQSSSSSSSSSSTTVAGESSKTRSVTSSGISGEEKGSGNGNGNAAGSDGRGKSKGKERLRDGVEILIVDDGSTDSTTLTSQKLAEKWQHQATKLKASGAGSAMGGVEIRVVTLKVNRGKGGAVQHGVIHSRGELILFADADGATRFSDLDDLLDAMDRVVDDEGHGMVVGSRAHLVKSEAVVKRSKMRNALMHGFHLFLRTIGVGGIRDTQCGFKLFTRPTAQLLFPTLHLPRWSFDVELLLLASLITPPIPVLEIPVAWHEVNGSKIRLGWDSIGMARDLLVLRGNLLLGRWNVPKRTSVEEGSGLGLRKEASPEFEETVVSDGETDGEWEVKMNGHANQAGDRFSLENEIRTR